MQGLREGISGERSRVTKTLTIRGPTAYVCGGAWHGSCTSLSLSLMPKPKGGCHQKVIAFVPHNCLFHKIASTRFQHRMCGILSRLVSCHPWSDKNPPIKRTT